MKPRVWHSGSKQYPWVVRVLVRKYPSAPPGRQGCEVLTMFTQTWSEAIGLVEHGYREGYLLTK